MNAERNIPIACVLTWYNLSASESLKLKAWFLVPASPHALLSYIPALPIGIIIYALSETCKIRISEFDLPIICSTQSAIFDNGQIRSRSDSLTGVLVSGLQFHFETGTVRKKMAVRTVPPNTFDTINVHQSNQRLGTGYVFN